MGSILWIIFLKSLNVSSVNQNMDNFVVIITVQLHFIGWRSVRVHCMSNIKIIWTTLLTAAETKSGGFY